MNWRDIYTLTRNDGMARSGPVISGYELTDGETAEEFYKRVGTLAAKKAEEAKLKEIDIDALQAMP